MYKMYKGEKILGAWTRNQVSLMLLKSSLFCKLKKETDLVVAGLKYRCRAFEKDNDQFYNVCSYLLDKSFVKA